jgi:ubiquinone/menaquinone biosynthesis C-methylase UbiE
MTEKENYPGNWLGKVPDELKSVMSGEATITVNLGSCLECLEHLVHPVYKVWDSLKVLDPACGTGEMLVAMAIKYPQFSFDACDISSEALAQAEQYTRELELKNIRFLTNLSEEEEYDFILVTRPLQHIDDLPGFLRKIQQKLAKYGLLRIQAYTGSKQEESLYLQEMVAEMKNGSLIEEEANELVEKLLAQPLQDHIDGLRECNQIMERAGFQFLTGLHPRNYEPATYVPTINNEVISGLTPVDRAYLAEQFCGQMLMHSQVYTHYSYKPEMPSFYDSQSAKLIPHLSPYARIRQQDERIIVSLSQQHLMLEAGIELDDLSLPGELLKVLQIMDGKLNCEQIHRRFLPMPWERFWALIQACWEEEIIYLHSA